MPASSHKGTDPKKDLAAPKPYAAGLDLEFDAIDLIHKVGTHRNVSRISTSKERVGDPEYGVLPDTKIDVNATLESVDEGIYVTGTAETDVSGECSRCLEPLVDHLTVRFDELFTYPEKVPAELEDDDLPILEGDTINLGPLVHDALAIAAPYQPLCSEDCLGLCDQCGLRMEEDPSHEHTVIDPRFAALAEFLEGEEEK